MSGLGYLFPSIRLSCILQANYHEVLFISTNEHGIILANYGINHFPIVGTRNQFLDVKGWGHPDNAVSDIQTVDKIINAYLPDVIITSPLAMISFILAEKYNIPLINIGFAEYLFAGLGEYSDYKRWLVTMLTGVYNSCRSKINLPGVNVSDTNSPLIGTQYLLRSIPALNEDVILPDKVKFIGDLYLEPNYINHILHNFISESKKANKDIVYVQIGRLFKDQDIWEKLIHVLAQLPMNYIVDVGRSDYDLGVLKMYNNFFFSKFIPIGAVSNDIDVVICSCHTTTVISAIIHSKMIIGIPHSADSIALAKRLESKSLALCIYNREQINKEKLNGLFREVKRGNFKCNVEKRKKLFLSYTDDVVYNTIQSV